MKNENGELLISVEELRHIADYAEQASKNNGDHCSLLLIRPERGQIRIIQHGRYQECNPIYHA